MGFREKKFISEGGRGTIFLSKDGQAGLFGAVARTRGPVQTREATPDSDCDGGMKNDDKKTAACQSMI